MKITKEVLRELISSLLNFRGSICYFDEPEYDPRKCFIGFPESKERVDRAMWAIPEGQSDVMVYPKAQCSNNGRYGIKLYSYDSGIKICEQHLEQLPSFFQPIGFKEDLISREHSEKESSLWYHLGDEISRGIFEEVRNSDPNEKIYKPIKIEDVQGLLDEIDRDCY